MMEQTLLQMKNIDKTFPGVKALDNVDFSVDHGEVHALMGENGAGKSTLVKILNGIYQKDKGEIIFDGVQFNPKDSLQAQKCGISTIYQELNLIPYLSVSENIFLGRYPKNKKGIDWSKMHHDAEEIFKEMGLQRIDVKKQLNQLGTAVQQMVAIARAISMKVKLVVMDEPTSSLDTNEVEVLFNIIRKLKQNDVSVIFISHRLDEVYQISDRITILKNGAYVGTYISNLLPKYELINKMVGKEKEDIIVQPKRTFDRNKEYILNVENIFKAPKVNGISFGIHQGEILGLAGLLGSGRTETAKIIFGYDLPEKGDIFVHGKKIKFRIPKDALQKKLSFCTEDRRVEGIIPNLSVKENITLAILPTISKFGFIQRKAQNEIVEKYIESLSIKTPHSKQLVKYLSGGNQQKVVLARWLCTQPQLIILDEPTRGIDVGAKAEIEKLILEFSRQGISILLISSELQELVRNCDRIIVIREGQVLGEIEGDEISENRIMQVIAEGHKSFSAGEK